MLRYYDDEDLDLAIRLIFRKTTTIPKRLRKPGLSKLNFIYNTLQICYKELFLKYVSNNNSNISLYNIQTNNTLC